MGQHLVDEARVPSLREFAAAIPISVDTGFQLHGSGASSLATPSLQLTIVSQRSAVPALADGQDVDAADGAVLADASGLSAANEFLASLA